MVSDMPTFNLKAVVRETGLKPDTIRAWERRYGVPKPRRTLGGHRLYSQHDIELLKWMNARQHEGLSISRSVDLWKSLESEGKDPLQATSSSVLRPLIQLGDVGELAGLRREWVQACLNFDEPRTEQATAQAFALFSLNNVVLDVLLRGLAEIGEGWYRGEVAVQQEHFASALTSRRLQTLIAATPAPTRAERILLACPPEEQHTISLLAIHLFLRREGWDVIDLGANVPLDRLAATLGNLRPQLVISSAQQLPTARTLQELARNLTEMKISLGFGGSVFNQHQDLRRHIAGRFLGEELRELPMVVKEILRAPWTQPVVVETPRACLDAALHFRERQSVLEAEVKDFLKPPLRAAVQQAGAFDYFARYITAALELGDIHFLDSDLNWVRGLLAMQQLPDDALLEFLQVYWRAGRSYLDERGSLILDWLQQAIEELGDLVAD